MFQTNLLTILSVIDFTLMVNFNLNQFEHKSKVRGKQ